MNKDQKKTLKELAANLLLGVLGGLIANLIWWLITG